MTDTGNWQGKVAVITGGSSGIGAATANALAEQGANVLITGRTKDRLDAVAARSPRIEPFQIDSGAPDSGRRIVEAALALWGRLDLVVNNAGAGQPMPLEAYNADVMAQMSTLNITAPSQLVQAAQPALKDSAGAIVNISTAVSRHAAPMLAHYGATKAALENLTQAWATELAKDGVRVNAIAPGPVKSGALTGMMGLPPEVAAQIEEQETAQIPLGRRGVTADIVPWILRLGSGENEWLTGQVLTIDGGWSLRG